MAAQTDIPDVLEIDVPVGGRVIVMADLHLAPAPSPAELQTSGQLAATLDAATGPGVVVVAGDLFQSAADPAGALAAHPRFTRAMAAYSRGRGRRVVVLPGARDARLAGWAPGRQAVTGALGAEMALAVELSVATGAGVRRVRVEPGYALDALSRFEDPRNPLETPYAQHVRDELLPSVRRRGGDGAWLAGMERLDDTAAFSRFIASRLTYRRLGRWAWLLAVPVVTALALRLPSVVLRSARHGGFSTAPGLVIGITLIEVLLLFLLAAAALRSTATALSALSLEEQGRDPNETARAHARALVTEGYTALLTGHTCRPELTHLGRGFYANAGCSAEVVTEAPSRLPGLGLPPAFLAHRDVAWIELEAGSDLHARLFHARQDVAGATLLERLVARPVVESHGGDLRPDVVAVHPGTEGWPRSEAAERRHRRVRRAAGLVVFLAGFLSLLSALAEPIRDRLDFINQLFPLAVPETAAALAALGGLGLIVLARGIRRGQRRAWVVCMAVLLTITVLHLVKGVDVEEALVALAVAVYLWVERASFTARTDVARMGFGLGVVALATGLTLVAGMLALELGSWITSRRPHALHRLSWANALLASLERMVGIRNIRLPMRLDEFFSPVMATAAAGLGLAFLVVVFRPVVQHRRPAPGGVVSPPAGRRPVPDGGPASGDGGGAGGGVCLAAGDPAGLARARAVFTRHGSGTLDYFALRPDKQFFFWGDTVVAHAVYGGVCLVSPDPIGPVPEREEAWRAFRRYVDDHGWALGGLGAGEEWLPIYRATGMHDLYVGDEAVVQVDRFTLEGGRFKGLRQAVNRVAKYGYRISFHDPAHLDPALRASLEDVMTKSRRGDVERGFSMTLGRVFDPDDTGLLLAVVHGPVGEGDSEQLGPPVAFCQYVPAPGIGGYSLDLMRRDDGEHPNGLIDFAVVETIRELARRGGRGLGLNFATMRAVLAGEAGEGVTQRVQAWVLRRMGDSMQIESLWKFNAKFDPDWQPRYAVYDAPENMLAVAIAVARAESFWELPVIGRFLVPSVAAPGES